MQPVSIFSKIIFSVLVISQTGFAAPNLMLFPTRIVFDKNKRSQQLDITNTGADPGTYRITLEDKRMTEDGRFIPIDKFLPGELSAEKIIQYSPRQVELVPGSGQTIRIVLRKPADLPVGEYRSHLLFTRLPDANLKNGDTSGVIVTPLIGASIPIIIENGATTAEVKLTQLKYLKAKPNEPAILELHIERSGNRSVYGDIIVNYVAKGDSEKVLANVKGLAVYAPYASRIAKIALQSEGNKTFSAGKLTVKYTEPKETGGKLLSEASIEIP